jgi:hypothetical protein
MLQVGQRVDHRHRGPVGVGGDVLMAEGADRQGVAVAAEHPGGVGDRLPPPHLGDGGEEVDGLAPQPGHRHGETHPGAGGRLAEDQPEHPAGKINATFTGLELGGQMEQGQGLLKADVGRRKEIFAAKAFRWLSHSARSVMNLYCCRNRTPVHPQTSLIRDQRPQRQALSMGRAPNPTRDPGFCQTVATSLEDSLE